MELPDVVGVELAVAVPLVAVPSEVLVASVVGNDVVAPDVAVGVEPSLLIVQC